MYSRESLTLNFRFIWAAAGIDRTVHKMIFALANQRRDSSISFPIRHVQYIRYVTLGPDPDKDYHPGQSLPLPLQAAPFRPATRDDYWLRAWSKPNIEIEVLTKDMQYYSFRIRRSQLIRNGRRFAIQFTPPAPDPLGSYHPETPPHSSFLALQASSGPKLPL
jgi:hypothetical protein